MKTSRNPASRPLSRNVAWAALLGASVFLGACVTSSDDSLPVDPKFAKSKVDARIAGQTLVGSFQQGQDWNSTVTAPAGLELLSGVSANVGTLKQSAALAKMAADIDVGGGVMANLDDTGKGFATLYHKYNQLFDQIEDTVVVKWDDVARDTTIKDKNILSFKRVTTHIGGKKETAEFADADGNGLVNAVAGKENKVKLTLTVLDNGTLEKTDLVVGAGKDANFDKEEDNTILSAGWTRSKNGVVIGTGAFKDADNDGVVTDNSKDCVVLAEYTDIEPKDRPLIQKVDFKAKVRVLANKMGDEPLSFSYTETTKLHRTNVVTIKNREGGDEIVRGDTLTVHLETSVGSATDTLKSASIDFVMNPGQNLKSEDDDVCYAIHIKTEKQFGLERTASFNFISATPIPHGQEPTAGTFDGEATYANGKSITLKGSFSPDGFSATFTGPDGSVKVEYTKSGDVI